MFGASRILTRPAYSLEAFDINLLSRYGSIAEAKIMYIKDTQLDRKIWSEYTKPLKGLENAKGKTNQAYFDEMRSSTEQL